MKVQRFLKVKFLKDKLSELDKKQLIGIVIILVLIIGVGVGVYLVQREQIIRSRASAGSFVNAFEFRDKDGNVIQCDSSTNPPTCITKTLEIQVRVKDVNPLLP